MFFSGGLYDTPAIICRVPYISNLESSNLETMYPHVFDLQIEEGRDKSEPNVHV